MWFKGQKIDGDFDYVLKKNVDTEDRISLRLTLKDDAVSSDHGQQGVLAVFANILEQTEGQVTIERFNNYGRHKLPTVTKPLREFENDYRLIEADEKKIGKESAKAVKREKNLER